MSTIRADIVTNTAGTGAPTFTNGIKTPSILDASGGNTVTVNGSIPASLASPAFTGTPTAPTAAVGTNTTQIATTAFVLANTTNRQVFTSSGTWTKPSGARLVLVRVWGGGGGGAGGEVGGAGLTKRSAGGGGGAYFDKYFYPSVLSATVTVTVGIAGTGGASNALGVTGGTSSFGAYIVCEGGIRGATGDVLGNGGGAQGAGQSTPSITVPSLTGGSQTNAYYGGGAGGWSGVTGFSSQFGGGGGGGSGWENGGNVLGQPGAGGQSNYNVGGLAGTSVAGAPTVGGAGLFPGSGGGGGGSAQTANGAAGGAGGFPAGGGGAGGTARTGFLGGTGGAGGAGYVEVYTW